MNEKTKDLLLTAHYMLVSKADFFKNILDFQDDPELIEALEKDGISEIDPLFDTPDKLYGILNAATAHTRQYLILKSIKEKA